MRRGLVHTVHQTLTVPVLLAGGRDRVSAAIEGKKKEEKSKEGWVDAILEKKGVGNWSVGVKVGTVLRCQKMVENPPQK